MRAVLGIDAAWSRARPSGVAVAAELRDGWRLIAAASSYQRFRALADNGPLAIKLPRSWKADNSGARNFSGEASTEFC